MFNSKDFKGIEVSDNFKSALENEKYANKQIGSNPALAVGMSVTAKRLDFFPNISVLGQDDFDELTDAQKRRAVKNEDGTYSLDNSYFGIACEGAVGRVSFTSLVGYAQYSQRLTKEQKAELEKAAKGKTIVNIKPGAVDFVGKQAGTLIDRPLTCIYQAKWAKNSQPTGVNKPLAFDQRMDVWAY